MYRGICLLRDINSCVCLHVLGTGRHLGILSQEVTQTDECQVQQDPVSKQGGQ